MGGSGSKLRFGAVMGVAHGVPAHSSDYWSIFRRADGNGITEISMFHDNLPSGIAWQCVQYSRRFLIQKYAITYSSVGMAYEIFELKHFLKVIQQQQQQQQQQQNQEAKGDPMIVKLDNTKDGRDMFARKIPAVRCSNGKLPELANLADNVWVSAAAGATGNKTEEAEEEAERGALARAKSFNVPGVGALLIWADHGHYRKTGHVAVVSDVVRYHRQQPDGDAADGDDGGAAVGREKKIGGGGGAADIGIRIAEQNYDDASWNGRDHSRELPATINQATGALTIHDPVQGGGIIVGWIAPLEIVEKKR